MSALPKGGGVVPGRRWLIPAAGLFVLASSFLPLAVAQWSAGSLATPDLTVRVRNAKGEVVRSSTRRAMFLRLTGYPHGRPGYRVEHLVPLACAGGDTPGNMAWLTEAEWRAKVGWERRGDCRLWSDGTFVRLLQWAIESCSNGTGPAGPCASALGRHP